MPVIATKSRVDARNRAVTDAGSQSLAFVLFCAFIVSYFVHLGARVSALGALRIDLLLAAATLAAILFTPRAGARQSQSASQPAARNLKKKKSPLLILVIYIVVSLPLVEWPGTVLNFGIDVFLKCLCFYFFVIYTVTTVAQLRAVLFVYVGVQVFRILEPLYMHLTTGYWGSFTSLANWEYMDRLSGAPFDIINPNGLGFLVVTTLPLLHFLCPPTTRAKKAIWLALAGAMTYALVLSASRSSFLALVILALIAIYRSKHRVTLFIAAAVFSMVSFGVMNDLQRDRYFSIFSSHAKSSATAEGRITGLMGDLEVAMHRPLFGHGLGTSREANANFRGEDKPSHDLYTEVAEELGFIGLGLFISVIVRFVRDCLRAREAVRLAPNKTPEMEFLSMTSASLYVLILVYLFFSFASYGLSEPYWYFIGGLCAVTVRLAQALSERDSGASGAASLNAVADTSVQSGT